MSSANKHFLFRNQSGKRPAPTCEGACGSSIILSRQWDYLRKPISCRGARSMFSSWRRVSSLLFQPLFRSRHYFCQTRLGASAGLDNRPLCFQSRCFEADRHNSVWWWNCFSPFSRSSETPLLSTFCSHHAKTVILLIFGPFPLRPAQRIRQLGSHDEVEVLLPHVLPKYPSTLICWHPCLFFVVIIKQFLCRKPGALIIMHRVKGIEFFQPPCGFCFRNFYGSWRSRWPIVRGKRLVWGQT